MKASRRMLSMAGVQIRQFVPSGKITIDFDIINKKQKLIMTKSDTAMMLVENILTDLYLITLFKYLCSQKI